LADIFTLFRDTVFGPDELQAMGEAFDLATSALPHVDRYEIAATILRYAKDGTHDATKLCALTLRSLDTSRSDQPSFP
jgi:hypothetical protein